MSSIEERASVRQYTDEPVSDDEIRSILRAAMAAPSAGNQQPWEFYIVRDEATRQELAAVSPYAGSCKGAPVVIAACMHTNVRFPMMVQQDMGACVQNALLRVTELGLGAVWLGIYPIEERVEAAKDVLGITDDAIPFALITLGHPAGNVSAKGPGRFDECRIHWK